MFIALLLRRRFELRHETVMTSLDIFSDANSNRILNDCVDDDGPIDAFSTSVDAQFCVGKVDTGQYVLAQNGSQKNLDCLNKKVERTIQQS